MNKMTDKNDLGFEPLSESELGFIPSDEGQAPTKGHVGPMGMTQTLLNLIKDKVLSPENKASLDALSKGAQSSFGFGVPQNLMTAGEATAEGLSKNSNLEQILKDYQNKRAIQQSDLEQARQNNPIATTVGEIGGGAITPLGPAGEFIGAGPSVLGRIGRSALVGGGIGAAGTLGKASSLQDIKDTLPSNVALGATLGGAGGALSEGLGAAINEIKGTKLADIAKKQYAAGREGISTGSKEFEQQVGQQLQDVNKDVFSNLSEKGEDNLRKELASQYSEAIPPELKQQILPDVTESLKDTLSKTQELLSRPEELTDQGRADLNKLNRLLPKDSDATLEDFLKSYKEIGSTKFQDYDAQQLARQARSTISDGISDVSPEFKALNDKYSNLFAAREQLGLTGQTKNENNETANGLITKLKRAANGSVGLKENAQNSLEILLDKFQKIDPQKAEDLRSKMSDAIKNTELQETSKAGGFGKFGMAKAAGSKLANMLGRAANDTEKSYAPIVEGVKKVSSFAGENLNDITPESIQNLGMSDDPKVKQLADQLGKMFTPDMGSATKNAIIFNLLQNPQNRKILRDQGLLKETK